MKPGWKWAAAAAVLVLGIAVSVSGAATSGSKRDGGGGGARDELRLRAPLPPPGEHLSALADELGVSEDKLRDALGAVRDNTSPPKRPRLGEPPSREQMERRCTAFTDALAKELDKSGDEVRAAIKAAAMKGVEEAVDDGHLTRRQADRILSKLDDAACLPAFGLHIGGHGCGGPGGPDGPGARFERHAPPPAESGSGQGPSVEPAVLGAPS